MHTHDRVLPHLKSGNAGENDGKTIESCQNDDKSVLEMDVPQVSLKLIFRGQERPSLDSIEFLAGPDKYKADAPQDRDLTKAVAVVLLLFRAHSPSLELTLFRIRAAKSGSFVDTILNAKKQSQNKSPICALANGAFLRLFLKPRPVTSRYLDIDQERLKPTAVTVVLDGRAIDDPRIIGQITTLIATRKNWDLRDYTIDVLPEARDSNPRASELQIISPLKANLAQRAAAPFVVDGPNFLGSRDVARSLCPYKGLFAFWEQDADVFFGRESLIQLLIEKLDQKHIVQVSGPSGSGKSSLVAAGLIPALKASDTWQVLYCRPGSDPFASLASALIPHLKPSEDEISRAAQLPRLREVLEQGQLCYLLRQAVAANGNRALLLFIDQFEELFTQCNTQTLRDSFLDTLLTLMGADAVANAPRIRLVYTVRADFANRLLSHRGFTDAIQDADVKIGPMNREELDSVIRRPASLRNVRFEEGLAERILNDAGVEPSTLPLLEVALAELWERHTEGTLTHAGYERIGQLSGAIAHQAEKVIRSLGPPQQEVARHILARLVRLADELGEHTRQRIPVAALYSEELLNKDAGRKVLYQLTQARLGTVSLASDPRQQMVEIAHEALVRRWPRLKQWLG